MSLCNPALQSSPLFRFSISHGPWIVMHCIAFNVRFLGGVFCIGKKECLKCVYDYCSMNCSKNIIRIMLGCKKGSHVGIYLGNWKYYLWHLSTYFLLCFLWSKIRTSLQQIWRFMYRYQTTYKLSSTYIESDKISVGNLLFRS